MPCDAPWIILRGIHRECRIELLYDDAKTAQNTNFVYINGDGNSVNTYQNISSAIEMEIDKLMKSNELSESERTILELFSYKLKDKSATKQDADKVLDMLEKYVPIATAVIDLLKSLFN